MCTDNIRNFAIISHVDHGKSTLADRFLELTRTVEKRKMREQFLDQMELERERGITIKMQPVRMQYKDYVLNLIDTPGHIDFAYEVSRSLKAVEGVILLVDATQGVQAQTVSNLELARSLSLVIIPVINKIDSPNARVEETKREIVEILALPAQVGCDKDEILEISAKTGEGVEKLLEEIIKRIPAPKIGKQNFRALVFDFEYSLHRGVVLYIRVVDGEIKSDEKVFLFQAKFNFSAGEVGVFTPFPQKVQALRAGEIGYVVTNMKESNIASVGDTLFSLPGQQAGKDNLDEPLRGYKQPSPVVWASVYPETSDNFLALKQALERLHLSDSSLSFEEEESGILGRGFRCGFLGMLHLEIVIERLRREFKLELVTATPSVVYKIENNKGELKEIYSPALFPEHFEIQKILEPWVRVKIITPFDKLGDIMQILKRHEALIGETEDFGQSRVLMMVEMSLREMMNNFFEELKSVTAGYASLSYKIIDERPADLVRLDVLLNNEAVPAFSRIVSKRDMQREAKKTAERLYKILPKALFAIKIQTKAQGRILAARSLSALKKDVTGHLYGGDRTRKMKLWQKQKKGKEKLKKHGRVNVPHEVFLKMVKSRD